MNRTKELKQMKSRLSEIVDRHEKLKNSYFWSPCGNANSRRNNEKRNNDKYSNERFAIYAENSYRESCSHVYYKGVFKIEGKKTTVAKIKNIIAGLNEIC